MPKILEPEEPEGMNMTPMIDVTFQLIIFFMLVTDMSSKQLDPVTLPVAEMASKEKFIDESLLVLNVHKDGSIWIQGKRYFQPPKNVGPGKFDARKLEDVFAARRAMKVYQQVPGNPDLVRYPILIRADRSSPWQWVQLIMMIGTVHGGVTRVQMGAMREETP